MQRDTSSHKPCLRNAIYHQNVSTSLKPRSWVSQEIRADASFPVTWKVIFSAIALKTRKWATCVVGFQLQGFAPLILFYRKVHWIVCWRWIIPQSPCVIGATVCRNMTFLGPNKNSPWCNFWWLKSSLIEMLHWQEGSSGFGQTSSLLDVFYLQVI